MKTIIGIKLSERTKVADQLQGVLSKYGCIIRTRIGLHDVDCGKCSDKGVILLEVIDDDLLVNLQKELCQIENIEIQQMMFNRD